MRKILVLLAAVGLLVVLLVTAAPALADGKGPPHHINNIIENSGDPLFGSQDQGPPIYINITWLDWVHPIMDEVIQIIPTTTPAN